MAFWWLINLTTYNTWDDPPIRTLERFGPWSKSLVLSMSMSPSVLPFWRRAVGWNFRRFRWMFCRLGWLLGWLGNGVRLVWLARWWNFFGLKWLELFWGFLKYPWVFLEILEIQFFFLILLCCKRFKEKHLHPYSQQFFAVGPSDSIVLFCFCRVQ